MAFSQHIAIARRENVWESPPGPTEEVPEYLNGISVSWGDRNYSPLDVIIVPRLTCNLVGTGQLDFDRPYQEGDVLACWVRQDNSPIEYWFAGHHSIGASTARCRRILQLPASGQSAIYLCC